jgi:Ca-activated chloride channel family protein
VRFSTEAEQFRPQLCDTSKESLDAARGWIQKLEARGGTNIQEALDTALRISQQPDHIQMIFFLTDGLPTVGVTDKNQILASVRAKNTNNLRIFTFGVGFDVNTQLLDALSTESRAAREYVYPQEDVEVKVSALFDKVAFPVLSDVSIDGGAAGWFDVYPRALPDLFKGSAMIVTGRYRGAGKIPVRLSGKLGGARREYIYELHFPQVEEKYDTVPALWAGRKVGFLVDEIRLRGANPELIEEVRRLGREFNIITPYTSFLVVEEGRRLATARDDRLGFLPAGPETKDGAAESLKKFSDLDKQKSGEDAVELSLVTDLASNNGSTAQNAAPAAGRAALAGGGGGKLEATLRQNARNVGRRVFININNVWVDSRFTDKDRAGIVKIKFLSDEYFALLAKEPGLSSCLALGTRVVVNCKGVFYEVES